MCFKIKWDLFWGNKSSILLVGPGCVRFSYPRLVAVSVCVECFLSFCLETGLFNWF